MRKLEKTYPAPDALDRVGYEAESVKEQLRRDQHNKCCYCEQNRRGGFFDVEHYRPKKECQQEEGGEKMAGYSWLQNDWDNLLYSCNDCNRRHKRILFPLRDPSARDIAHQNIDREEPLLLNPYTDDVASHLRFHEEVAVPAVQPDGSLSDRGRATIEVLKLNDRAELIAQRRKTWRNYKKTERALAIARMYGGEELISLLISQMEEMRSEDAEFLGMLEYQE